MPFLSRKLKGLLFLRDVSVIFSAPTVLCCIYWLMSLCILLIAGVSFFIWAVYLIRLTFLQVLLARSFYEEFLPSFDVWD